MSNSAPSAVTLCQGTQDLEPLLVSICTPDLKCGFAVTRLLSQASGDGGRREGRARKRLTRSELLHHSQTRAVMLLSLWNNNFPEASAQTGH